LIRTPGVALEISTVSVHYTTVTKTDRTLALFSTRLTVSFPVTEYTDIQNKKVSYRTDRTSSFVEQKSLVRTVCVVDGVNILSPCKICLQFDTVWSAAVGPRNRGLWGLAPGIGVVLDALKTRPMCYRAEFFAVGHTVRA